MNTKLDTDQPPEVDLRDRPGIPGPADAPPRRGRGIWFLFGGILLVVGLGAAAAALYANLTEDDAPQRRAGKLIGSGPAAASSDQGSESSGGSGGSGGSDSTADLSDADVQARADLLATLEPHWPVVATGRPDGFGANGDEPPASAGDLAEGWYLWQDFDGWHLWLVGGQGAESSVEITSDDEISKADPTGGSMVIERSGNRLVASRGGAGEDVIGVEFNPGFYARTMVVTTSGDLPMHLGAKAVPAANYVGLQYSKTS